MVHSDERTALRLCAIARSLLGSSWLPQLSRHFPEEPLRMLLHHLEGEDDQNQYEDQPGCQQKMLSHDCLRFSSPNFGASGSSYPPSGFSLLSPPRSLLFGLHLVRGVVRVAGVETVDFQFGIFSAHSLIA